MGFMKKTVYIHIGPHKTGTTTIQHGLALNEKSLRKKGVLVPKSGRPYPNNGGSHNLSWELRIPNSRVYNPKYGTWKDLLNEIAEDRRIKKIILTSEDFCLLDEGEIRSIREYLAGFRVKVIIYLRRQDKAHQSLWVEFAKNRANLPIVGSFVEWLEEYDYAIRNYDYLEIISKWEAVFSQENMILRLFDTKQFEQSLFHDFLNLCHIQLNHVITPQHTNISPGVKTIEAIRLLKNHIDFSHIDERKWNTMAKGLTKYGTEWGWNEDKVNYLTEELSSKIMGRHEKANTVLAMKYFNRENLFDDSVVDMGPSSTFTYDEFSKEDVIKIFSVIANLLTSYSE
jgi:hypothetical protein